MKVNALKKGSFIIDFSIQETLSTLFSGEGVTYLSALVTIVGDVYKAYKHFRGRPIEEKDKGSLTINKDVTITKHIINFYNQPIIREAISKSIETAKNDDNVDCMTISSGSEFGPEDSTSFDREEFNEYIYTDFSTESKLQEEIVCEEDATLTITSLSFERNNKWRFVYKGFPISMYVKDDALTEAINRGERLGKGDALRVRLSITKKYNDEYHTYINSFYRISEVYEHIKTPSQSTIDF